MVTKVPLPAGTTLGKSYEYGLDVNLAAPGETANWQPVRRISEFQPTPTPVTTDAATYDDFGAPNEDVDGWSWQLAFNVQLNRLASGQFLPELEALLARTKPSAKGEAATIEVRWYHKPEAGTPHPTDAGQGIATVAISRTNVGNTGVDVRQVTLTGKGPYEEIANPFTGWAEEPVTP